VEHPVCAEPRIAVCERLRHKFSPQRISRIHSPALAAMHREFLHARDANFFYRNCYNYVELRWRSAFSAITWLPLISAVQYGHLILCKIMEMSNYARWLNYKRLSRNWVNLNCGINGYLTRFRLVESRWCDDIAKVINDDDSRGLNFASRISPLNIAVSVLLTTNSGWLIDSC